MSDVLQMINALGYPVCVSVALYFALVQVFRKYTETAARLIDSATTAATAAADHAAKMAAIADESNAALAANTTSNRKLVDAIENRPFICHYPKQAV